MYRLICQKSVHFLSAQMAFFHMFIVLGMYNFVLNEEFQCHSKLDWIWGLSKKKLQRVYIFQSIMLLMLPTPNLKSGVNTAHRFWNVTFSEYFIAILFQATFRNNKSSNLHWTLTPLSSVTAAEKSWFSYDLGNARPWEVFWQEKPLQLQLGNIYWNEIIYLIV